MLNECGENIQRFVSHYLDLLPPMTFNNIDVSTLLGKMEQLSTDGTSMKRALELQTTVCEGLRDVSENMGHRVSVLEGLWASRSTEQRRIVDSAGTIAPVSLDAAGKQPGCSRDADGLADSDMRAEGYTDPDGVLTDAANALTPQHPSH